MKKIISIIFFLIVALLHSQSLTNTENYIYTRTYLEPVTSEQPNAPQVQTVQYFDGLGRTIQSISIKASPTGKDLVVPMMYDQEGRKTKDYLPQPVDSQNGAFIPGIGESSINSYYNVPNAYSEVLYERSPLMRIEKSAPPGADWQINGPHTKKIEYLANHTDEVKRFKAVTTWNPSTQLNDVSVVIAAGDAYTTNGYYNANTLSKTITKDEDNNETHIFSNSQNQNILVRKINRKANGAVENIDTYYVYDEFGNLSLIIPPKVSSSALTPTVLDQLCYHYRYDKYNRLAEKKLPGKGWEYIVYDKQNRPVLSQDANMRTTANNFGKQGWIFTKYDAFGRVVYTGFFANTASRAAMQAALNNMSANALNNETSSTTPFNLNGLDIYYTKSAFPTGSMTILSVNYYDEYPAGSPSRPSQIQNNSTLPSVPTVIVSNGLNSIRSTKTLPTAGYTKNIEDDKWTSGFIWYDMQGRVIGTYSKNHLGGYTKTESELDFTGLPQKSVMYHARKSDESGVVIQQRYIYDSQKRLIQHYHKVDNKPEVLLTENTYNELSQLINKKVGNNLQSIDYAYNIRGWLTDVNKDQMNLPDLGGRLFSYRIKYNSKDGIDNPDPVQFSGKNVTPKFGGNIAEVDWRAIEIPGVNPSLTPKRYGYAYDDAGRLTAGYYQNPNNPYSKENSETLEYDLNGNITNLYRTSVAEYGSNTATVIDNLAYTYRGNQAVNIKDNSGNSTGYEGTAGYPISYDANGNMKNMMDKQITNIGYNYLNLPSIVNLDLGQITTNISTKYRADGVKLRKEHIKISSGFSGSETTTQATDYLDGFQYFKSVSSGTGGNGSESMEVFKRAYELEAFSPIGNIDPVIDPPFGGGELIVDIKTPDLQFFSTAEGYYDYQKDQYIYQYTDHLGNTRVSFGRSSTGVLEIVDSNDYYPFGMNHLKTGSSYYGQGSFKSYKYNGKQLQETGMYDYGWRMYMPDIARWNGMDQLAESYHFATPYAYVLNNPANMFDPDGRITKEWFNSFWNNTPEGTNSYWFNGGSNFISYDGGGGISNYGGSGLAYSSSVGFDGGFTKGDGTYTLAPVAITARGTASTWNNAENYGYNSYLMMSKLTGVLGEWNLQENRAFYYNEVARTGADKVERNFYLMFGGALAAPFVGSYIATLGGETAASYLQGALIRGGTDMILQQTIKGSVDWKQTGINAFIGGGQGFGAVKVGWLNYGGNMLNNFGTSIYEGTFNHDLTINSMKALTGIFGMGVANYNGLTNGYLSGYFGTTLLPGIYFNTTDVVIEQNKNKK